MDSYKIVINFTPGDSSPWSYGVFRGITFLAKGKCGSRNEAKSSAERFADDHAENAGAELVYEYTPELGN
jgi:hypothetical protein